MNEQPIQLPVPPKMLGAEPQLFVTDVAASCKYFEEVLGFLTRFCYGEPAFYAQVARDAASINLRWVKEPVFDASQREAEALLSATVVVNGVKELFLAHQAGGADFAQTLRREPWGAQTYIVRDPDGNLILFAG